MLILLSFASVTGMQGYVGQFPGIALPETVVLAASMVSGQEKTSSPV
jgi:hypothetical protein